MMETSCAARHTGSDQMHCAVCRLIWDVNEEDAARMCPRASRWEVLRPLIETLVGNRIVVPPSLVKAVRARPDNATELSHLPPDIWYSRRLIPSHTDSTDDGLVTYGCVLINDGNQVLLHGGQTYSAPAGTLYRFDGRIEHETLGQDGLFAALIWDMPPVWDLTDFAAELRRDARWTARLERTRFILALAPDFIS